MDNTNLVLTVSIATVIGSAVGFSIKTIIDYFQAGRDRNDKYYFALIKERMVIHQQAYTLCKNAINVLHGPDEERNKFMIDSWKWFNENCLYFSPWLRGKLRKILFDVENHHLRRDDWKNSGQNGNADETRNKAEELMASFDRITGGIFVQIEKEMDSYYKALR